MQYIEVPILVQIRSLSTIGTHVSLAINNIIRPRYDSHEEQKNKQKWNKPTNI